MAGVTLCNCFDGIANGTTVTTGNSGGASGAAWDTVTTGTGTTLASDNAHQIHNGQALKIATGASAQTPFVRWNTSLGTVTTCYWRVYAYWTGNPASTVNLIQFGVTGLSGFGAAVTITTAGKVQVLDTNSTQQIISTASIPLNTWFRLEGYVTGSATVGKAQLQCFFAGADNTTASETHTTGATLNTGGAVAAYRLGINNSLSNIGPFWVKDTGVTSSGLMGPSYSNR